jgi:hypothetical protein
MRINTCCTLAIQHATYMVMHVVTNHDIKSSHTIFIGDIFCTSCIIKFHKKHFESK